MLFPILKAVLSGILIALISEIAKRNPGFGALIASLPLISVMAMIWMWRDTGDAERIAAHSAATFWYVLPSLPMFLVLPLLLRLSVPFYAAMGMACAMTVVLYFLMVWTLRHFGITL